MPINKTEFRKALGLFTTGVTIVSTLQKDNIPRGFTANSFTSVSLDPPLILICIGDFNESKDLFSKSKSFAVNILNEEQMDLSNLFAKPSPNKFDEITWHLGELNTPLIDGSLAWFECENYNQLEAGDHIILIGKVKYFGKNDGSPLGYFQGNYITLDNEKSLVNAISKNTKTILGVIFDNDDSILFNVDKETGYLSLPSVGEKGEKATTSNLLKKYQNLGFKTKLDFVYSVYEDKNLDAVCIYYRSKENANPPNGSQYIKFEDISWDKIQDDALVTMLKRYVEESSKENFAIYMGDETSGFTHKLI